MMQTSQLPMRSPSLYFRRLQADDFSLIAPILRDAQTMYAWEHGFSHDEVCEWLAEQMRRYRKDGCGYLAAFDRHSHKLVGLAGALQETIGGKQHVGIGYIVSRHHWGKGYGIVCAKASLSYAFITLGAQCAVALIRPENIHSVRVAEQCGMACVGVCNKTYRGKDMPHLIYAIAAP